MNFLKANGKIDHEKVAQLLEDMDDLQANINLEMPMGFLMALVAAAGTNENAPWTQKCQEAAILVISSMAIDKDTEDENLRAINDFFVYIGTHSMDIINTKTPKKNARKRKTQKGKRKR